MADALHLYRIASRSCSNFITQQGKYQASAYFYKNYAIDCGRGI